MSNLKLSEAIQLGAMLAPQGFERYKEDGRTCALGAACEAIAGSPLDVASRWPFCKQQTRCPACSWWFLLFVFTLGRTSVERVIVHLNDDHRWTRERIADWVAAIEFTSIPALVEHRQLGEQLQHVSGT